MRRHVGRSWHWEPRAHLLWAHLPRAHLPRAHLLRAHLLQAHLPRAHLPRAREWGGRAPGASAPCAPEGSHSPVPDSTPCSCHQQGDQVPGSQPVGVPLAVRPGGPGVLVPQGPWPEPSHPWRQTLRARRPVHAGRGGAQGWGSQAGTPTNGS